MRTKSWSFIIVRPLRRAAATPHRDWSKDLSQSAYDKQQRYDQRTPATSECILRTYGSTCRCRAGPLPHVVQIMPAVFDNNTVAFRPPPPTEFILPQYHNPKTTVFPRTTKMASMDYASALVAELPTAGQAAIRSIHDAGLGEILRLPGSDLYEARNNSYWSCSPRLRPWAIVQPRSAEEVSTVVKALVSVPECQFAIRRYVNVAKHNMLTRGDVPNTPDSGGHMSWPGASNIGSGITIDLGEMDNTTYNEGTKIASIQPGGRWTDVYAALDKGELSLLHRTLKLQDLIETCQRGSRWQVVGKD